MPDSSRYVARLRVRTSSARKLSATLPESLQGRLNDADGLISVPLVGVTTDGEPIPGLFPLHNTGSSLTEISDAAVGFLGKLDATSVKRFRTR
jgi:hypothetical protein